HNDAEKPESRYFATPEELFAAMRRIREAGQSLLGVYHSHPRTPAYPSASDVEMAFYPEAFYFIISLEPRVELRAFRIEESRIEDVEIVLVSSPRSVVETPSCNTQFGSPRSCSLRLAN